MYIINAHSYEVAISFVIHPPLMIAQSWAASTWEIMEGLSTNSYWISWDRYGTSKGLTKKYVDKNVYHVQSNIYIYIYILFPTHIADCYTHLGYYAHNVSTTILSSLLLVPFVIFSNLMSIAVHNVLNI